MTVADTNSGNNTKGSQPKEIGTDELANVPSPTASHPPSTSVLPVTLPINFYGSSHTDRTDRVLPEVPHVAVPTEWRTVASEGPAPFSTHLTFTTPSPGVFAEWESRRHRKQVEQTISYREGVDGSEVQQLKAKRKELARPWYSRLNTWHLTKISWHSVLWWNIGSHCLVYAGVCLFIPFFNENSYNYLANNGWGTIVVTAGSWLIGALLEVIAVAMTDPLPRWFQLPRKWNSLPKSAKGPVVDPHAPRPSPFRLDYLISVIRLLGTISFLIGAIAFSGSFYLREDLMIGLVVVTYIAAGVLFMISGYLAIVEVTHSWNPFRRNPLDHYGYYSTVLFFLASICLVLYGAFLAKWQDILDQRHAPAYPLLIASILFTLSDWFQAIEQGDDFYYQPINQPIGVTAAMQQMEKPAPPIPHRPSPATDTTVNNNNHHTITVADGEIDD